MKITVVRQLMLFVALIAVLSVGITSVIFHYKSNELFMSETKQKLFGQNKSKVDLIATITEEYRTELERLSANREVNELLNSVPGSANYQNLFSNVNRELTSLVQKKNDSFESAYLVDKRGIGIAASDQHLIGTDFSNQEYNKLSVSGMLVSGETLIPGVTGALVTVFTQPIKQNDQIMGYIVATFHTKSFSKFLGDVKVNNTASSYAELLNSKGTIIFGNEAGMFGKKVEVPEIKTILNRIEQGDKSSGIVVINSQGVNSMVSFGTVPETNWVLVIYENVDEIMAPVTVMNRFSLIIALILIAFSCLLGFVFAKKISRPLNSLTNLVIQTANLDFTTEESLFKKLAVLSFSVDIITLNKSLLYQGLRVSGLSIKLL